jgi:hypothetical protein
MQERFDVPLTPHLDPAKDRKKFERVSVTHIGGKGKSHRPSEGRHGRQHGRDISVHQIPMLG